MELVVYILLLPFTFALYAFVMSSIFPKYLLRISYNVTKILGRGLKKFVYPEGRAVLYEAQPDIRKYIERYALFTSEGFKYIQLTIARGVKNYKASVVMLDNRNKVIDVLVLSETTSGSSLSRPTRIHGDTSYVAVSLSEVNGISLKSSAFAMTKLREILIYFAAVCVLSFLVIFHIYLTVESAFETLDMKMNEISALFFIVPPIIIGISSLAVLLFARAKNGIKVVLK